MSTHFFSAQVDYYLTTTGSSGPSRHESDSYKKKRSSGLELLRPKSSHGSARHVMTSPEPLPAPPVSALHVSSATTTAPEQPWREDRFAAQRATLRHARSIPQLPPITPPRNDKKGKSSSRWRPGAVEIAVQGSGGKQGGTLTIYDGEEPVFRQHLKSLPQHTWSCDDIQQVHVSVYERQHVLSLRLPLGEVLPASITDSKKQSQKPKGLVSQMSTLSKLGRRARGYTVNRMDSSSSPSTPDASPYGSSVAGSIDSQLSEASGEGTDRLVLVAFTGMKVCWEWYALLRSFGGCPYPRTYRRLQIRILDLQETTPLSHQMTREDTTSTQQAKVESLEASSAQSSEGRRSAKDNAKLGWAGKEQLRVEIWLDERIVGRTTWTKVEDNSSLPFWAELFTFEEFPDFSACVLRICRLHSGKSQVIALVPVPLVTNCLKVRDERYPVRSVSSEAVIGELRMIVSYQPVNMISGPDYILPDCFRGMGGTRTIYYMTAQGHLDQTMDLFTRLNWAIGTTLNRLLEMCEIEAKQSGETLFRSNTPLTRLLEATMRLVCGDFLRLSIGPTVTKILEHEVEFTPEDFRLVLRLVRECWDDMYSQRGSFPNILRIVFSKLFKSVKENHEERKLHYKAVSSFLFLRLIGPALMRPHLFDLARGIPKVGVQRTLTLVAKIFHAMAFFTYSDTARDPELRKFAGFIRENDDTMVDYLSSFATPLDEFQARPPPPTAIETFLSERMGYMPPELAEGVPMLTRRRSIIANKSPLEAAGGDAELGGLIKVMDEFILGIHRKSYKQLAFHQERSSTPRASLQIDVGAAQRDRQIEQRVGGGSGGRPSDSTQGQAQDPTQHAGWDRSGGAALARVTSPGAWKWLNFGWKSPTSKHHDIPPSRSHDQQNDHHSHPHTHVRFQDPEPAAERTVEHYDSKGRSSSVNTSSELSRTDSLSLCTTTTKKSGSTFSNSSSSASNSVNTGVGESAFNAEEALVRDQLSRMGMGSVAVSPYPMALGMGMGVGMGWGMNMGVGVAIGVNPETEGDSGPGTGSKTPTASTANIEHSASLRRKQKEADKEEAVQGVD
ncbi:hypothetical protein I316_06765 [Kwoniella heveanensis BCC8398]|uniref:Ras-GAP domain-containing protein n=1 Tax=Kwoniella heveanensis BCC8398 TaxID=1296120 RepID=A0A1B9GKL7_9TREE|nr:hypothetical protein I316_06765 [Kwoniella heveanensis BCC8398]